MDRISELPIGVIETILCLLPIQEAARTSILSREWRYHWIKIPKLVFNEKTFQVSTDVAELSVLEQTFDKPSKRKEMAKRCKLLYAIYQVLLMHQGPIHEFTICMEVDDSCVENEIDRILLHLSKKKNTLKILKLDFEVLRCYDGYPLPLSFMCYDGYPLPLSLFSLHHLTELYLYDCALFHEPSFYEFRCLTTLNLRHISTCDKTLLRLLSSCPSLKRLTLHCDGATIDDLGDSSAVDLFKCLPVIEYLSVWFNIVECFPPLQKEPPTTLAHLKCLLIEDFWFSHKYGLPFLVLLIRSSPNLEKLELVMEDIDLPDKNDLASFTLEDYSDIMLEHLNELEIIHFSDAEYELDFVQLILARSPVLKKVRIFTHRHFDEDKDSEISKILLCSPCASPVVKFTVGKF